MHIEASTIHTIINGFAGTADQDIKSNVWILRIWITFTSGKPGSSRTCILKPFHLPSWRLHVMWSVRLRCCYSQFYCVSIYIQILSCSLSTIKNLLYLELALQTVAVLKTQRGLYQKEHDNRDWRQLILDLPAFWLFLKVKCCFKGCSLNDLWFVLSNRLQMAAIHRSCLLILFFWLQTKHKAQHMLMGLPEGEMKEKKGKTSWRPQK